MAKEVDSEHFCCVMIHAWLFTTLEQQRKVGLDV